MKKLSTFLFVMMAFVMMPLEVNAQDYEVEAANIAAFNAVEDGKVVKLTLTNARVNAELYGTYYVEDATGATAVKGVTLTKGKLLNGYFIGKKATEDVDYVNTPSQGLEYSITVITHRRNIARKLQIHSPAGLTIYAIVNGLVDISTVKL